MTRQEELRALRDAATPGPWQAENPDDGEVWYVASTITTVCPVTAVCKMRADQVADASLIAQAPILATELADALDREEALKARIAELEAALKPFADIDIGTNPDYEPIIKMDRQAIVSARAALAKKETRDED